MFKVGDKVRLVEKYSAQGYDPIIVDFAVHKRIGTICEVINETGRRYRITELKHPAVHWTWTEKELILVKRKVVICIE